MTPITPHDAPTIYGCTYAEAIACNGGQPLRTYGSPACKYRWQRHTAAKRGIAWEITLPEWVGFWEASGKWDLRGDDRGSYCMARRGDEGPYRIGNVFVSTVLQNMRDAAAKSHVARHGQKHGRGWTYLKRNKRNPYQVTASGRYVGCFATQAAAEAAYLAAVESIDAQHLPTQKR